MWKAVSILATMYNNSSAKSRPHDTHVHTHVRTCTLKAVVSYHGRDGLIGRGRKQRRHRKRKKIKQVIIVHESPSKLAVIARTYTTLSGLMALRIHRLAEVWTVVVSTTGYLVVIVIIPLLIGKTVHSHALLISRLLL